MSLIDTDGRSPRFLTRAQKWAITNESAPRSSKKWLSTDTRSTRTISASTPARILSVPVVGPAYLPWVIEDSARSPVKTFLEALNSTYSITHSSQQGPASPAGNVLGVVRTSAQY